jgi:acetylornithine/succinyldiaminopimelate/putrescine aminotransferase
MRRGLLINNTHDHVLRFLPPFILTARQVEEGLSVIEKVLATTARPQEVASSAAGGEAAALEMAAAR